MKDMIYRLEHYDKWLPHQADEIVQRTMSRLLWNNVYLISAETEVETIGHLHWLAHYILLKCNRIVVLTLQSEFTHLIIAKSNDVSYLHVNEILSSLTKVYGGDSNGNKSFAHATFYKPDIAPEIIDRAVESVVIALPNVSV